MLKIFLKSKYSKMAFLLLIVFAFLSISASAGDIFHDLCLVREIDEEVGDELPFFYNYSCVGGYYTMPSARLSHAGDFAFSAATLPPYWVFGANIGVYDRIELSANYRIFRGCEEPGFGKKGFGDDAERIGNVKFGILCPDDNIPYFPYLAFGLDDVIGTKRFSANYLVATKEFLDYNLELTLGYGWKRIKGFFGGAAWSPFRNIEAPLLRGLSFLIEYDANNYKKHHSEHIAGRKVRNRFNGGISYLFKDIIQFNLSSIRGVDLAGSLSVRYPLGTSPGFAPKVDDPAPYTSPIDAEPMGPCRPEKEFAYDLACSFTDQGLDLYEAYLFYDACMGRQLYLKVVNNRYRNEEDVRCRIQELLSRLLPSNICGVKVVIEADGVQSHSYNFRACDLFQYLDQCVTGWELETLAPMKEVGARFNPYEAAPLFRRRKDMWNATLRPRVINFFGSTSGKFKYSFSLVAELEGNLMNDMIYNLQTSYSFYSSMHGLVNRDDLNPSRLIHVRTDSVRYFQEGKFRLEQFFLQRSWNLGKGWFFRTAGGYFEPAYGGGAAELLLYPVDSVWALGFEAAVVKKRNYQGIFFTNKVPKFTGNNEEIHVPYTGVQYFLDLYYNFKPMNVLFSAKIGQFLAKDKGVRVQATRYFPNGTEFALWVTVTNGHDRVNGHTYFDKGFAFNIPLDLFMKKSSRSFFAYAMSAWLRDVGAIACTGFPLFPTLYEERYD